MYSNQPRKKTVHCMLVKRPRSRIIKRQNLTDFRYDTQTIKRSLASRD